MLIINKVDSIKDNNKSIEKFAKLSTKKLLKFQKLIKSPNLSKKKSLLKFYTKKARSSF